MLSRHSTAYFAWLKQIAIALTRGRSGIDDGADHRLDVLVADVRPDREAEHPVAESLRDRQRDLDAPALDGLAVRGHRIVERGLDAGRRQSALQRGALRHDDDELV